MIKKVILILCATVFVSDAFSAPQWIKSRGRTAEEAFYNAQERYGSKFIRRGSCGNKQSDGYIYCDVLIAD